MLIGKRPHLTATCNNVAEERLFLAQWHQQHGAEPAEFGAISQSLIVDFRRIGDLDEALSCDRAPNWMIGSHPRRLAQEISKWAGEATHRNGTEPIAVGYMQATGCSTAEAVSLIKYRVEHRL